MTTKVCRTCGLEKRLEEFHRRSSAPDGRRSECKECRTSGKERFRLNEQQATRLLKRCSRCGEKKDWAYDFSRMRTSPDGKQAWCKQCVLDRYRETKGKPPTVIECPIDRESVLYQDLYRLIHADRFGDESRLKRRLREKNGLSHELDDYVDVVYLAVTRLASQSGVASINCKVLSELPIIDHAGGSWESTYLRGRERPSKQGQADLLYEAWELLQRSKGQAKATNTLTRYSHRHWNYSTVAISDNHEDGTELK